MEKIYNYLEMFVYYTKKIEKNPTKKLKEILKINKKKNEKNYPKKSNGFGIKK